MRGIVFAVDSGPVSEVASVVSISVSNETMTVYREMKQNSRSEWNKTTPRCPEVADPESNSSNSTDLKWFDSKRPPDPARMRKSKYCII